MNTMTHYSVAFVEPKTFDPLSMKLKLRRVNTDQK